MALTEENETQCWVKPDGQLEIMTVTHILRDGVRVTSDIHRNTVDVGGDVSGEASLVRDIAQAVFTPARKNARENAKAKQALEKANPGRASSS